MRKKDLCKTQQLNVLTIDVEDWYHVLDTPAAPDIDTWERLESRVERNLSRILTLLREHDTKATFFWLGWVAERHEGLVRKCYEEGHEIASHGYAHLLPFKEGAAGFRRDIVRGQEILENITGEPIRGYRAPGFGITPDSSWAFDVLGQLGYQYDASVFPAIRGHGGMASSRCDPHTIHTKCGKLRELPMSVVQCGPLRMSLSSGGYLRLTPLPLIRWGVKAVHSDGRPFVVLVHPRDIDPAQPRLDLGLRRSFQSYVNLHTTYSKLRWLVHNHEFVTVRDSIAYYFGACE